MKLISSLILFFVITYIAVLSYLYFNQGSLLYHPERDTLALSEFNLPDTVEITILTKDGLKLQAWYRKPDQTQKMAIVLHGNSGNLADRAHLLKELISLGYGFIIPAWRGFGKSEGSPTLSGLYLDAESAIDFVQKQNIPLGNTVIIGESLGTGIAAKMATQYKFKGVFLITPYKSISARADELYPFMMAKHLTKDDFNVIDKIDKVNQPVFIIHCTEDKIVPISHAKEVFHQANEPKKIIIYNGCNHTNYDAKDVFTQMDSFLSKVN